MSVGSQRKCLWDQILILSLKLLALHLLQVSSFLTFRQYIECRFTLTLARDMIITNSQTLRSNKYSQDNLVIWPARLNFWFCIYELSGCGFESRCCHLNFRYGTCFEQEFLDIQATIKCGFTLKRVRDMTRTYSQMHRTDKYSEHSSIIWPVWLNGWVFV